MARAATPSRAKERAQEITGTRAGTHKSKENKQQSRIKKTAKSSPNWIAINACVFDEWICKTRSSKTHGFMNIWFLTKTGQLRVKWRPGASHRHTKKHHYVSSGAQGPPTGTQKETIACQRPPYTAIRYTAVIKSRRLSSR